MHRFDPTTGEPWEDSWEPRAASDLRAGGFQEATDAGADGGGGAVSSRGLGRETYSY